MDDSSNSWLLQRHGRSLGIGKIIIGVVIINHRNGGSCCLGCGMIKIDLRRRVGSVTVIGILWVLVPVRGCEGTGLIKKAIRDAVGESSQRYDQY